MLKVEFLIIILSSSFFALSVCENLSINQEKSGKLGEDNLCNYNGDRFSKFNLCTRHLNISRYGMPQLGEKFLDYLYFSSSSPSSWCTWTNDARIYWLSAGNNNSQQQSSIFVSNDECVLDGHHRWAASGILLSIFQ
jgi:hypothetical protein